eukprot:1830442-Rhodomonas_salina.1
MCDLQRRGRRVRVRRGVRDGGAAAAVQGPGGRRGSVGCAARHRRQPGRPHRHPHSTQRPRPGACDPDGDREGGDHGGGRGVRGGARDGDAAGGPAGGRGAGE